MGKLIHGFARRGKKMKTYLVWESMFRRCTMPSQDSYPVYGGRGIRVTERWRQFESFLIDMGECPDGCSLDRIDSDGHYEPGNCRWASMTVQSRNRGSNQILTFNGRSQSIAAWAEEVGIKQKTLRARIFDHGWNVEDALTTKIWGRTSLSNLKQYAALAKLA